MVRRDFLKFTGLLSAALFLQIHPLRKAVSLPVEVESQGKLYRGTYDGKIYVSENAGKSWQLHTNFGSAVSILGLRTANLQRQVHAHLGFGGHRFELELAQKGQYWKTV